MTFVAAVQARAFGGNICFKMNGGQYVRGPR